MSEVDLDTGDFDLDAAAEQYDQARADNAPSSDEPPEHDDSSTESGDGDKAPQGNPHGHLSYQEWVDAGKDPDDYVGRNAYQAQHERIVDNRKLEKEVKGLKRTQEQTLEAIGDWQKQEQARIRSEIEAELHQAKEDEDVQGALDAQQKLDEHDRNTKKPQQQANEEIEVIVNFREANPVIDQASESFDPEFNAEVELAFNGMLRRAMEQKREVTDAMVNRWLKKAYRNAVDVFGEDPQKQSQPPTGESERNNRPGKGQQTRRRGQQKPREPRAEDVVLDNPRNPRQKNAAAEIRDLIADKYGDDAAKGFEKSITS